LINRTGAVKQKYKTISRLLQKSQLAQLAANNFFVKKNRAFKLQNTKNPLGLIINTPSLQDYKK
jgi:hypothetical protein